MQTWDMYLHSPSHCSLRPFRLHSLGVKVRVRERVRAEKDENESFFGSIAFQTDTFGFHPLRGGVVHDQLGVA